MTTVVFGTSGPRELLSHLLLGGAGAICENGGIGNVRVGWTSGMEPRPWIEGAGASGLELDAESLGSIVRDHAAQRWADDSWLHARLPDDPARGLLSPRIRAPRDDAGWRKLQKARLERLDSLTEAGDLLDLRLIAALGEPASWRRNALGQPLPDDGASRLEMQPRNQGSEFIGSRLRPLAEYVATRAPSAVADGLLGNVVRDDKSPQDPDSRTATNLRPLGPTDSSLAWVALWGISQFPLALKIGGQARTATHVRSREQRAGFFVLPVWEGAWTPARLRSVLASDALAAASDARDGDSRSARSELCDRGVIGLVCFPVGTFGSSSAPERRALIGEPIRLRRE